MKWLITSAEWWSRDCLLRGQEEDRAQAGRRCFVSQRCFGQTHWGFKGLIGSSTTPPPPPSLPFIDKIMRGARDAQRERIRGWAGLSPRPQTRCLCAAVGAESPGALTAHYGYWATSKAPGALITNTPNLSRGPGRHHKNHFILSFWCVKTSPVGAGRRGWRRECCSPVDLQRALTHLTHLHTLGSSTPPQTGSCTTTCFCHCDRPE